MRRWCFLVSVALAGCTESATTNDPAAPVARRVVKQPQSNSEPPVHQTPATPNGWIEFREPNGAFSIVAPGLPHAGPMNHLAMPGGVSGPKMYDGAGNGLRLHLSYFERNPAEVPAIRATMYEQGGTAGLQSLGKVQSRRDVVWAGHSAVEFELQSETETTILRVLNVGNRFYSAWIAGKEGQPTAAEREAFFGSFTLGL